jgi:glycosyltransferase involved in cell wall biosynthesis
LLPAMLLLSLGGRKVIYDAHEDTPLQTLSQHWIPRWLRRPVSLLYRVLEWFAGRRFEAIVAAEPAIAARYPSEKTVLVRNFPRTSAFSSIDAQPYEEREPLITYVGSIAEKRGAKELVQAIHLVKTANARLNLCGTFHPARLQTELRAHPGWQRVSATGWIDRFAVVRVLSASRIGMVTLHPIPKYLRAYPTKLFEYMAAGLPIVASDFPLWRELVEQFDCTIFVDPMSPEETASAIDYLLENPDVAREMGERGRAAAVRYFDWSIDEPALLALYDRIFQ